MSERDVDYPVVRYDDNGQQRAGVLCSCCGAGPDAKAGQFIRRACLCDGDGVFFSMLCEYCLEDILDEKARRQPTDRDGKAALVADLLGDDLDGAAAMMDDLAELGVHEVLFRDDDGMEGQP